MTEKKDYPPGTQFDSNGNPFMPTPHSNMPVVNQEVVIEDGKVDTSDPTREIRARYVPVPEARNLLDVFTKMIETIPKLNIDDRAARWDPATELWRTETLREALKKLKTDTEYAPPEAHQNFWIRGAVLMREHFPDHLVMNVMVAGQRVDAGMLKRNGQRVPDAAMDTWERAVMRVWIPSHFKEGGRWHLTTNSGGDQ